MEDIIIRGGLILDGTGSPGIEGDVAVSDGRITRMGNLKGCAAARELDARGYAVAPGFIDSHAHSDTSFLQDSSGASKIYQGITTEITGQCGDSPFPCREKDQKGFSHSPSFEAFVECFETGGWRMGVNQALLVGHGTLREAVVGCDDRAATPEEMEAMKGLLRRDLAAGAWGLSLGLEYAPGFFADVNELSQLACVVKEFEGLVPCHMRNEGVRIHEAIEELAQIGRQSGAHMHISHLKLDHYSVHGQAERVWEKIRAEQRSGVHLTADMYPFTASSTGLSIRCPQWSKEGGSQAVVAHLKGRRRQEVIEGIRTHYFNRERAETCLFSDDGGLWPEIVGKTLPQVAEAFLHTTDYALAAAEVLIRTEGRAGCTFFVMDEKDMLYFLEQDVGIGSDGYALPRDPSKLSFKPHPRSYGAVAEFFRLAREHRLCPVEEAVRRVTSKPADLIGLKTRGRLMPGMRADITVFDPAAIRPQATYLEPVRLAKGVKDVLMEGQLALADGCQTDLRLGRFLRKT
ncbi:MAG: amidohydrolase family protein [Clostridia bacterium]|nr:amidohydrolase family protein [Clostridia bacterium]